MKRITVVLAGMLVAALSYPAGAADAPWAPTLGVKPLGRKSVAAFPDGTAFFYQQEDADGLQGFTSTDFGVTWTPLPRLPIAGMSRVAYLSPAMGFALVDGSGARILKTTDGGRSWEKVRAPWKGLAQGEFVHATDDGRTVVVGARVWRDSQGRPWGQQGSGDCHDPRMDRLQLFLSNDFGASWKKRSVNKHAPVFSAATDFTDIRHGVVIASDEIKYEVIGGCEFRAEVATGKHVLMTNDGGRSFREILTAPKENSLLAVAMPSAEHVVVGGLGGEVWVTFNGGRTFEEVSLDGLAESPTIRDHYRWIYDLDFGSDEVGYASTNGRGLWRTVDGGLTWEREPSLLDLPGHQGPEYGRIAAADDDRAIAVGPTFVVTRVP